MSDFDVEACGEASMDFIESRVNFASAASLCACLMNWTVPDMM